MPAKNHRSRHASIMLPFDGVLKAFGELSQCPIIPERGRLLAQGRVFQAEVLQIHQSASSSVWSRTT